MIPRAPVITRRAPQLVALWILVAVTTGCEGMSRTQKGALAGTAAGAGIGALIGKQHGSAAGGALIGGAIGALSGGLIGNYMDRQAEELEKVADTTRTGDGIIVTLRDKILFDVDSATIKPAAAGGIDKLAAVLARYPRTTITVAGFTDNTGRPEYNVRLSERRANAVQFALAERGVRRDRIATMGFGAENPVASNASPEGRAQNRRVELHIVPDDTLRQEQAREEAIE